MNSEGRILKLNGKWLVPPKDRPPEAPPPPERNPKVERMLDAMNGNQGGLFNAQTSRPIAKPGLSILTYSAKESGLRGAAVSHHNKRVRARLEKFAAKEKNDVHTP